MRAAASCFGVCLRMKSRSFRTTTLASLHLVNPQFTCFPSTLVPDTDANVPATRHAACARHACRHVPPLRGAQFTCFTSTKVIALLVQRSTACACRHVPPLRDTQFTRFTSTPVQILTHKALVSARRSGWVRSLLALLVQQYKY